MLVSNNDIYTLELYKKVPNSPYQYEETPSAIFKGHPASKIEKRSYRIQKGVNGDETSTYVSANNLPIEVDYGDRIKFLGKIWTVQSVGYFYDMARLVNADVLSEEQIIERCPKGLGLQ